MKIEKRKLKREAEKRRMQGLQEMQEQQEQQAKLKAWKESIPEKKEDVTDDKIMPGVRSLHYFPLSMTKQQEANVQMAKEKGRHTFGSPNLLFIQSKGRFVHYQK